MEQERFANPRTYRSRLAETRLTPILEWLRLCGTAERAVFEWLTRCVCSCCRRHSLLAAAADQNLHADLDLPVSGCGK